MNIVKQTNKINEVHFDHSSFYCFFSILNNANLLDIFALFKCIQFTQADDYHVCLPGVKLGPCACIIQYDTCLGPKCGHFCV